MNLNTYKKSVLSRRMFIHTFRKFFVILGVVSAVIGIVTVLDPGSYTYGFKGVITLMGICLLAAFIDEHPRKSISTSFSHPDIRVTLKVGNILEQKEHLVIGFSDTFDTEVGDIISVNSLQGKFLSSIYNHDRTRLDRELDLALEGIPFTTDSTKTKGKNKRYEIGTTVAIPGENRKFFCCGYSYMGSDLKASSDVNNLWISLEKMWAKIRYDGEQKSVAMPVIGTQLARVQGISFALPIKLILLSFIVNSRIECIAKELTVVILEEDMEKINMIEMKDYIESLQN